MTNSQSSNYQFDNNVGSLDLFAHSIGLTAEDRIQTEGEIGLIHSIFRSVINVTVSENRLITIVGKEVGQGSLNIVVTLPPKLNLTTIGIKIGDTVTRVGKLLIVGQNIIKISMSGVKLWEPTIFYKDSIQPIKIVIANIDFIKETTLASSSLNGLGELIRFSQINGFSVPNNLSLNPIALFAAPYISSLLNAIISRSSHNIKESTKNIVGLGPGLTPAGDDMILGLMISMLYISANFNEINYDINQICEVIASSISGRTTIISEEFLREASIGKANEPIITLLTDLLTSGPNELEFSAKRVLALGSTSGSDVVFGIILGSHLLFMDLYH